MQTCDGTLSHNLEASADHAQASADRAAVQNAGGGVDLALMRARCAKGGEVDLARMRQHKNQKQELQAVRQASVPMYLCLCALNSIVWLVEGYICVVGGRIYLCGWSKDISVWLVEGYIFSNVPKDCLSWQELDSERKKMHILIQEYMCACRTHTAWPRFIFATGTIDHVAC